MNKALNKIKNSKTLRTILSVIAIVLLIGGFFILEKLTGRISIEDSVVSAPITSLSPIIPGNIKRVAVVNGQNVKKGDLLAEVGTEDIRAYTNGIIIDANRKVGSLVSAQTPVINMIDTSQMRIDGTIDENKGLNKLKVGQVVSFTVDALPNQLFWGYVDEISESAKQTQAAFSISSTRPTQQFDVYAKFDVNAYPQIKNGMSAKLTVYTR